MNERRAAAADRNAPYGGYHQTAAGRSDDELARVGPGTACGEYLRRYWHPVAMTAELADVPRRIRILGEDLVLFRDRGGRIGLVHRHCPHRRSSLEFGACEARGIRCCYHGWLFDIDGTVLEVPGQPEGVAERVKAHTRLGAYPVKEFKGLVFAYLGPPDAVPDFPLYDTYDIAGQEMVPYRAPYECNWLQVLDAILDPIHTSYLHSRASRPQFSEGLGEIGELAFYERGLSFLGANTRRVGDNVWVRVNEYIMPNFTQAGAAFAADGTEPRYFGRTAFTRWVVPIDDENTVAYAWAIFGPRADPPEYNTPDGPALIEQGELFGRSYDQRQRFPGDAEAVEGMGPISDHMNEFLVSSDKGIVLYRKRLRAACRDLAEGTEPQQPTAAWPSPIPTYGGDTVLRLPLDRNDDRAFLQRVEAAVMEAQFAAEHLSGDERDGHVIDGLKRLEADGIE